MALSGQKQSTYVWKTVYKAQKRLFLNETMDRSEGHQAKWSKIVKMIRVSLQF